MRESIRRLSDTLSALALCTEIYDECAQWTEEKRREKDGERERGREGGKARVAQCLSMAFALTPLAQWHQQEHQQPRELSSVGDVQHWCSALFSCSQSCLLCLMSRLVALSHCHDCNLNQHSNTRYIHRNWYHSAQLIAPCHRSRFSAALCS